MMRALFHIEVSRKLKNKASLSDVKSQKQFTELKPDDSSSPLRLSKEQFGRFSWYNRK
jgi:hypothetical protein